MAGKLTKFSLTMGLIAVSFFAAYTALAQDRATMARDEKASDAAADSEKTTKLTVQVLDEATRKPIYNAHVVVRFEVDRKLRRDKRVSWESKANQRGEVVLNLIPRGTVKVQVIARGYQTYGDQHDLNQPEETVVVAMKTPSGQKSAY
jgi:hypothetical protein